MKTHTYIKLVIKSYETSIPVLSDLCAVLGRLLYLGSRFISRPVGVCAVIRVPESEFH